MCPAVQQKGKEVKNECEQRERTEARGHREEFEATTDDGAQQIEPSAALGFEDRAKMVEKMMPANPMGSAARSGPRIERSTTGSVRS